jgi:hypothetical protein
MRHQLLTSAVPRRLRMLLRDGLAFHPHISRRCLEPACCKRAKAMFTWGFHVLTALVILCPLLSAAESASAAIPRTPAHHEGAQAEDALWTKNVSTTVDNCNWWNNYGEVAVGSPGGAAANLTFESVCATSLWGGLDIDVFNKGARIACVPNSLPRCIFVTFQAGTCARSSALATTWSSTTAAARRWPTSERAGAQCGSGRSIRSSTCTTDPQHIHCHPVLF